MNSSKQVRFQRGFSLTEQVLFIVIVVFVFAYFFTTPRRQKSQQGDPSQVNLPQNPPRPPGLVVFSGAGVSLVPGDEWQRLNSGPLTDKQAIALPVLEGVGQNKGSLIQVFSTIANSDAKTAAVLFKKEVDAESNTIKGTFKQNEFVSNSGVPVVRISYDYGNKGESSSKKYRAYLYLFQNKRRNCIAIYYILAAHKDSARVDQMIQDTLGVN